MLSVPKGQAPRAVEAGPQPSEANVLMALSTIHSEGRLTEEQAFQSGIRETDWYKEYVQDHGEEPALETKDYDYRKAWEEGARPNVRDSSDFSEKLGKARLHWPSKYKGDNHPNRFIDGVDTRED